MTGKSFQQQKDVYPICNESLKHRSVKLLPPRMLSFSRTTALLAAIVYYGSRVGEVWAAENELQHQPQRGSVRRLAPDGSVDRYSGFFVTQPHQTTSDIVSAFNQSTPTTSDIVSTANQSSSQYSEKMSYQKRVYMKNRSTKMKEKKKLTTEEDCLTRYGKGRLGYLACGYGTGKQSKAGANSKQTKKDSKNKHGKGKTGSTSPSIAPSTLSFQFPTLSPTRLIAIPTTNKASPSGGVPTITPTVPPTATPNHTTTIRPSLTTTPSVAIGAAPSLPPGATATPSLPHGITPTAPALPPGTTSAPSVTKTPSMGPPSQLKSGMPTQPVLVSPTLSPTPRLQTASPNKITTKGPTALIPTGAPMVNRTTGPAPTISPNQTSQQPNFVTMPPAVAKTNTPSGAPSISPVTAAPATTSTPTINASTVPPTKSFERSATPFSSSYSIPTDNYTVDEFGAAQNVTIHFLEDYVKMQFAGNNETELLECTGGVLMVNQSSPLPTAEFGIDIIFANTSSFVPSQQEVDILIESAFRDPTLRKLVAALQSLPSSNPFSGTTSISYTQVVGNNTRSAAFIARVRGYTLSPERTTPPVIVVDPSLGNHSTDVPEGTPPPVIVDNPVSSFVGTPPPVVIDEPHPNDIYARYNESNLKITPFSVVYDTSGGDPSDADTDAAAMVTLSFLDAYLKNAFDSIRPGAYTYLAGMGVGHKNSSDSVKIDFLAGVQITESSLSIVSQERLDMEVEMAFQPAFVRELLSALQLLPRENPYSTTASAAYLSTSSGSTVSTKSSSLSTVAIASIAVAVVLALTFAAVGTAEFRRTCTGKRFQGKKRRFRRKHQPIPNYSIHGDLVVYEGTSSSRSPVRCILEDDEDVLEFNSAREMLHGRGLDPLFQSTLTFRYTDEKLSDKSYINL